MPRVIVIRGADEGKQFELTGAVHGIGRDAVNTIRLHDTEISRRHAEFRLAEEGYHLVDVGSANGTFVNNRPVSNVLLQSGDQIRVGQSVLVYSAGTPAVSAPSDLADRISLISRHDLELSSAIVKTLAEGEARRILSRPDQAATPWLRNALANLSVMYETVQAVSHILDLDQLLERIMDLIFRTIEADSGCFMLSGPEGTPLAPKAVRIRPGLPFGERLVVSRTITDHVLRERQGILVADASHDERFATGQSIVRFGIHEVICVPMKGRHETLGVLYLDTRVGSRDLAQRPEPTSKFTEEHLALAAAIAHQAALAVEDTRYHQAMLQAERLAAIGQTVAALSHHIKNILQGLRSGSDLLRLGLAEKDDQLVQRGWAIVEKNQAKIYDLVMDMLSYSKEREPVAELTDLNQIAREVLELVRGRAGENGTVLTDHLEASLPVVMVDPEGLHRALLNIVGNALDAVENQPGGAVTITTEREIDGQWVRVIVTDNGPGIPPERIDEIFKPFVSSKGAKGTGLGLAVSRKILREHGGDIHVESVPGELTRFMLRLPVKGSPGSDSHSTRELQVLRPSSGSHGCGPAARPQSD